MDPMEDDDSSDGRPVEKKKYRSFRELDAGVGGRHGRGGRGGQSPGRAQQPPPPSHTIGKLRPGSELAPAQLAVEVGSGSQRMVTGLETTRLQLGQATGVEFSGGGHDHIPSKQAPSTSMATSDGSKKRRRSGERVDGHVRTGGRGRSRARAQQPPPPRPTIGKLAPRKKLAPEQLAVEVGAGGRRNTGTGLEATRLPPGQATSVELIGRGHGHITSKDAPPSMVAHQRKGRGHGHIGDSHSPTYKDLEDITTLPNLPALLPPSGEWAPSDMSVENIENESWDH